MTATISPPTGENPRDPAQSGEGDEAAPEAHYAANIPADSPDTPAVEEDSPEANHAAADIARQEVAAETSTAVPLVGPATAPRTSRGSITDSVRRSASIGGTSERSLKRQGKEVTKQAIADAKAIIENPESEPAAKATAYQTLIAFNGRRLDSTRTKGGKAKIIGEVEDYTARQSEELAKLGYSSWMTFYMETRDISPSTPTAASPTPTSRNADRQDAKDTASPEAPASENSVVVDTPAETKAPAASVTAPQEEPTASTTNALPSAEAPDETDDEAVARILEQASTNARGAVPADFSRYDLANVLPPEATASTPPATAKESATDTVTPPVASATSSGGGNNSGITPPAPERPDDEPERKPVDVDEALAERGYKLGDGRSFKHAQTEAHVRITGAHQTAAGKTKFEVEGTTAKGEPFSGVRGDQTLDRAVPAELRTPGVAIEPIAHSAQEAPSSKPERIHRVNAVLEHNGIKLTADQAFVVTDDDLSMEGRIVDYKDGECVIEVTATLDGETQERVITLSPHQLSAGLPKEYLLDSATHSDPSASESETGFRPLGLADIYRDGKHALRDSEAFAAVGIDPSAEIKLNDGRRYIIQGAVIKNLGDTPTEISLIEVTPDGARQLGTMSTGAVRDHIAATQEQVAPQPGDRTASSTPGNSDDEVKHADNVVAFPGTYDPNAEATEEARLAQTGTDGPATSGPLADRLAWIGQPSPDTSSGQEAQDRANHLLEARLRINDQLDSDEAGIGIRSLTPLATEDGGTLIIRDVTESGEYITYYTPESGEGEERVLSFKELAGLIKDNVINSTGGSPSVVRTRDAEPSADGSNSGNEDEPLTPEQERTNATADYKALLEKHAKLVHKNDTRIIFMRGKKLRDSAAEFYAAREKYVESEVNYWAEQHPGESREAIESRVRLNMAGIELNAVGKAEKDDKNVFNRFAQWLDRQNTAVKIGVGAVPAVIAAALTPMTGGAAGAGLAAAVGLLNRGRNVNQARVAHKKEVDIEAGMTAFFNATDASSYVEFANQATAADRQAIRKRLIKTGAITLISAGVVSALHQTGAFDWVADRLPFVGSDAPQTTSGQGNGNRAADAAAQWKGEVYDNLSARDKASADTFFKLPDAEKAKAIEFFHELSGKPVKQYDFARMAEWGDQYQKVHGEAPKAELFNRWLEAHPGGGTSERTSQIITDVTKQHPQAPTILGRFDVLQPTDGTTKTIERLATDHGRTNTYETFRSAVDHDYFVEREVAENVREQVEENTTPYPWIIGGVATAGVIGASAVGIKRARKQWKARRRRNNRPDGPAIPTPTPVDPSATTERVPQLGTATIGSVPPIRTW